MDKIKRTFQLFKDSWKGFSKKQKYQLIAVFALVLALPTILGGVYTVKLLGSRAYIVTPPVPPTPSPTPIGNNVSWSTKWASFSANNYYIHVSDGTQEGRYFRVNPSKPCNLLTGEMVCVNSDPPDPYPSGLHYMTLEVTWFEYDIEMRMFIYLYSDGKRWWSNEIRVYNGQPVPNTEWIYFKGKFFDTPVGQAFTQNGEFRLDAPDPKTNNSPVTLSFSNVKFAAFMNYFPTSTSTPKPTPTVRPTPTPTRTPTPTIKPTPKPGCGNVCRSSTDCPTGLTCYQPPMPTCAPGRVCTQVMPPKICRNPLCPAKTNCVCGTPTPTIRPIPTPIIRPTPTPQPICRLGIFGICLIWSYR